MNSSVLRQLAALFVATWCLGAVSSCTTLDRDVVRTPSTALRDEDIKATRLGREWLAIAPPDSSMSGFRLLDSSLEALAARIAIIAAAERTLDLQYYIFDSDETGLFLVDRLMAAADRGVRVRILVDDMYAHGIERGLATFDAHPNIELRLFNPWTQRGGKLSRGFEFLAEPRLNHRMHNKLLIGDGTVAVFGGRNLADEYFDLHHDFEFKDLDVVAAGPVAAEGGRIFDAFWNGPDAIPVAGIEQLPVGEATLAEGRARLDDHRTRLVATEYADAVRATQLVGELTARSDIWTYAKGRILADTPDKTTRAGDPSWTGSFQGAAREVFHSAKREVLASSPYFVPRRRGAEAISALAARGVDVVILTNSFAANDVPVVHAGYAKYRARLVRDGVRIFELRRLAATDQAAEGESTKSPRAFGSANASLHAKTFVVDRERVVIGSANLDPRSLAINTEIGVLIESPELAEQVAQKILALAAPANSYRLVVGPLDELLWVGEDADGNELIFRHDPDTSAWQRFSNGLMGMLPIEGQI